MSNMYGYCDYHGPISSTSLVDSKVEEAAPQHNDEDDEDDHHNPLQAGFWMEGDSLAPPCGTSIASIHELLKFAQVHKTDVLYDFGCGDARICLEACASYHCRSLGVEVEADLVERANFLIDQYWKTAKVRGDNNDVSTIAAIKERLPRILHQDLRTTLHRLVERAKLQYVKGDDDDTDDSLPLPTIVVLYLLPEAIREIQDDLLDLLPRLPDGFRIVCNTWGLQGVQPEQKIEIQEESSAAITPIYLYTKRCLEHK